MVVVVRNVRNRRHFLLSLCFVLCAKSGGKLELLEPPPTSTIGEKVQAEGYFYQPTQDRFIKPRREAEKLLKSILTEFKVNSEEHNKGDLSPESSLKDDISRLDLRVGMAVEAYNHPIHNKYLCINVDLGGSLRKSITRLSAYYHRLHFKKQPVIVLSNVKHVIEGLISDCFILYAKTKDGRKLIVPPKKSSPGERVYAPGFPFDPLQDWGYIHPDKKGLKLFKKVAKDLTVNYKKAGRLEYQGIPMRTIRQGYLIAEGVHKNKVEI